VICVGVDLRQKLRLRRSWSHARLPTGTISLARSRWRRHHSVGSLPPAGMGQHLDFRSDLGNCDPAVTRRLLCESRILGFVFKNWSAGPGFEPGASRSRITRQFIQPCRFLRFSVRSFKSTGPDRPDLPESSVGLLHEVLQNSTNQRVDALRRRRVISSGLHPGHLLSDQVCPSRNLATFHRDRFEHTANQQ